MAENKSTLSLVFAIEDNKLILKVVSGIHTYEKRPMESLLRELIERELDGFARMAKVESFMIPHKLKEFRKILLAAATDISTVYEDYKHMLDGGHALGKVLQTGDIKLLRLYRLPLVDIPKDKRDPAASTALRVLIDRGIKTVGDVVNALDSIRFSRAYGDKRFSALCDTLVKLGIDPATKGMLTREQLAQCEA